MTKNVRRGLCVYYGAKRQAKFMIRMMNWWKLVFQEAAPKIHVDHYSAIKS